MITPLQLVSITDFILGALCLFLAGILFGKTHQFSILKPSSKLILFVFFVGMAAFMGGLDHGFFQPIDQRFVPTTLTYLFIALATFFLFKYTIQIFFSEKIGKILSIIAYLQLAFFVLSSFYLHNFLLVIANYSPILMLFFILNIIHLKSKKGNLYFIITCITIIIATLVQSLGFQISEFLNAETMYHIIAMIAYVIYYFGVAEILKEEQKS
jgi:hypothetical protein